MTQSTSPLHILVDSREASVSFARDLLRQADSPLGTVLHTSQPTLLADLQKVIKTSPAGGILLSMHCIPDELLEDIERLLRASSALPHRQIQIATYDCYDSLKKWCEHNTCTFLPNPLHNRFLPAVHDLADRLEKGKTSRPPETEMLDRIWTHYRLMVAIISRTATLSEVCRELLLGEADKCDTLTGERLRALRYYRLGEPDMAGGTYPDGRDRSSNPIDQLRERIRIISATDFNVLISGESGVGKETVAWAIHELSERRDGPFLALNCAGMPDELLESEMFGYLKGAHNQADSDHPGLLEAVDGGTVFLDELPEMSPRIQAKLLRFLESGEYRPLGSTENRYANARVIGAGQPGRLEDASSLRPDLKSRISQLEISIKPLREIEALCPGTVQKIAYVLLERYTWSQMYYNGEKINLTPRHIKELQARFCGAENADRLRSLEWRESNIRELNNLIRRWVVFGDMELGGRPEDGRRQSVEKQTGCNGMTILDEELKNLLSCPPDRDGLLRLAKHRPLHNIKKAYTRHLYNLFARIVEAESRGMTGTRKITQKQLAELLKVTENTISRYLN